MKKFEEMTKAQLVELLKSGGRGKNRGADVLRLVKEGFDSIEAIAEELQINRKNVSSILSGLRKKGHCIINVRVAGNSVMVLLESDEDKAKWGIK